MSSPRADVADVAIAIEQLAIWVRRNAPSQVSTSTITTLDTLLTAGPLRISALAEREAISQPGMTTLANRLEDARQAARIADPTDGRATLVRITARGKEVLAARHASRTSALLTELARLDEADQSALIAALPAVRRLVTADREPAGAARGAASHDHSSSEGIHA